MIIRNLLHRISRASILRLSLNFQFPRPLRERVRVRGKVNSAPSPQSSETDQIGIAFLVAAFVLLAATIARAASTDDMLAKRKPEAAIDLATKEGVQLIKGEWRYSDTKIIDADFKAAGPDGQPGGTPNKAYDFTPHAGRSGFDDSKWEVIDPTSLDERRSAGRLAFNWYRIKIIVPERVGGFDPTGSTLIFSTSLDDYAEIWVNGQMPRRVGRPSPATIQGFNMPNRVVLAEQVKPGDRFQIAILGINGPISLAPPNPVFFREAKVEFYR